MQKNQDSNISNHLTRIEVPLMERLAMTVKEFAGLLGKGEGWGHARVREGSVSTINVNGTKHITPEAAREFIARQQNAA